MHNRIFICVSGTEVMRLFVSLLLFPAWTYVIIEFLHCRQVLQATCKKKKAYKRTMKALHRGVDIVRIAFVRVYVFWVDVCVTGCVWVYVCECVFLCGP